MSRTVLVTGGVGFLGSHFTKNALSRGWDVTVIDNFSTCNPDNLSDLLDNPHLRVIRADICNPLSSEIAEITFDLIVNLASPASPPRYQQLAEETLRVGTVGVMHMVELARKHGAQLFHASTSEVYGDPSPDFHPQPERYWGNVNSYGERACYDESKRAAEAILWTARHPHPSSKLAPVDTNIVRIFNTYGPHMDPEDGRVVSNFIMQALRGQDITIYGSGKQTRSFCYVDDLIRGFMAIIDEHAEGPINLGNPGEFTMLELAEKVITLTKSPSRIVFKPLPKDDPTQRKPDIAKARELLHWSPEINLDEGLRRTIAYFSTLVDESK